LKLGPRVAVMASYSVSLALVLAGYLAFPKLISLSGLGASIGLYYMIYLLALAGGALTSLYLRRLTLGTLKARASLRDSREGRLLRVVPALAAVAGFMGIGALLGFRPSYIGGPWASLLSTIIYSLLAVPAAVSIEASLAMGDYAPLAAVASGLTVLNPTVLLAAGASWGPNAFLGLTAYVVISIALGLVGLGLAGRLGYSSSYLLILAMLAVMTALPVRVAMGALGLVVAALTGLYAAHLTSGLLAIPPGGGATGPSSEEEAQRAPAGGGGDSSKPAEDSGGRVAEEGNSKPGSSRAGRLLRRRLGVWVLVGLSVVLIALYSAGVMFWRPLVIMTGSMEPTLNPGDVVILKKAGAVSVGDVVSYHYKGMVITHRVVNITPQGNLITKGDANDAPDPYPVSPSSLVGKVWARIPMIGWLVILANWNGLVRMLVALIAGAVLVAVIIRW